VGLAYELRMSSLSAKFNIQRSEILATTSKTNEEEDSGCHVYRQGSFSANMKAGKTVARLPKNAATN